MSHIKQKQPHSSAPPTTRATASIAGSKKRSNYCDGHDDMKRNARGIQSESTRISALSCQGDARLTMALNNHSTKRTFDFNCSTRLVRE
ncbi:uncharacterized [Tachysurus ichikawai]